MVSFIGTGPLISTILPVGYASAERSVPDTIKKLKKAMFVSEPREESSPLTPNIV